MEPEIEPSSPSRTSLWPLALLGTAVALLSFRKPPAQSHKKNYQAIPPNDTTDSEGNAAPQQVGFVSNAVPSPQQTYYPHGSKKRTPGWEKAAVVVAFGILAVNTWQSCATQQSADATSDAVIRSNRPWIGTVGTPTVEEPFHKGSRKNDLASQMIVVTKNYGPSPALHVNIFPDSELPTTKDTKAALFEIANTEKAACALASMPVTEQVAGTLVSGKPSTITTPPFGQTIFPNEPAKFSFPIEFHYERTEDLGTELRIVGCIAYTDQFGTKDKRIIHHTLFCYHTPGAIKDFVPSQGLVPCNVSQKAD